MQGIISKWHWFLGIAHMIKIGIVGGTGYTGVELLRILATHSQAQLTAITSRKEDGVPVAQMYPSLRGRVDLCFSSPDKADLNQCDVVFFCDTTWCGYGSGTRALANGVKVIDLAAIFVCKTSHSLKNGMAWNIAAKICYLRRSMVCQS